jgi:hypothetical protein
MMFSGLHVDSRIPTLTGPADRRREQVSAGASPRSFEIPVVTAEGLVVLESTVGVER